MERKMKRNVKSTTATPMNVMEKDDDDEDEEEDEEEEPFQTWNLGRD